RYGFHVLKVKKNSPAFHAGIEEFFDYIVSINDERFNNGNSQLLVSTLQKSEGMPLKIGLYSSKNQTIKEVSLTPSKDWSADDPEEKSLIGCSIRFCSFEHAGENVWHVLEVASHSPAEMAGLAPFSDYIIGSPHMTLRNEDDFYGLVEEFLNKTLILYVYNSKSDSCREVILVPNHEWGGEGSLGCDVGYGYLHRIPMQKKKQVDVVLFDAETDCLLEEASQTPLPPSPTTAPKESDPMTSHVK
ncbi:hypothetical protein K501DRAFT_90832, partial [Backusella circina FSU 941]